MNIPLTPTSSVGLPEASSIGELLLKILFLLCFLIYLVFAFVVIRQVRLMSQTYETSLGPILTIVAWAHFFVALGVFAFAVLVL